MTCYLLLVTPLHRRLQVRQARYQQHLVVAPDVAEREHLVETEALADRHDRRRHLRKAVLALDAVLQEAADVPQLHLDIQLRWTAGAVQRIGSRVTGLKVAPEGVPDHGGFGVDGKGFLDGHLPRL